MKNLKIHNGRFITYTDNKFTVDLLGGVDLQHIERMVSTLRITHQNYPPARTTLDLYDDRQVEKLIRNLCEKWELKLLDVSKSIHAMVTQLENYRLERLKYPRKQEPDFEPSEEEKKNALRFLKDGNLVRELTHTLNKIGILGEDENALILFLAMASHKSGNPFSVICLAKSGIGKSYILRRLSECMPPHSYGFHSRISANALYYFDNHKIGGKAMFVEDLEWTTKMLGPLSTLQTEGRLTNTRATKTADGMLHSTTFEVSARLCLLACAYPDKSLGETALPFLCLDLNHSRGQDAAVMEYQKKRRAGEIKTEEVGQARHLLKCVIATLQNVGIVNPFATLIDLPDEIPHPRKSLPLLLDFIDVITYLFQHQRERHVDGGTGEVFIKTHPRDIELAFTLLRNNLFRGTDEPGVSTGDFYGWLQTFLAEAKTDRFTALDIRKAKTIHPRTLNRHLRELKLFGYIQVVGGNKNREGFTYKLSGFGNRGETQSRTEQSIRATLKAVWEAYDKENGTVREEPTDEPKQTGAEPATPVSKPGRRIRIDEKEEYTLKLLLELEKKEPGREYLPCDITPLSKRSVGIEARYLRTLWEQGRLGREWKNRQYRYRLTTGSGPVGHNPVSGHKTLTGQAK